LIESTANHERIVMSSHAIIASGLAARLGAVALAAVLSGVQAASAAPPTFDTRAQTAYLADVATGTVLYEKEADKRIQPASMSKLMTLYIVFERLKSGSLKLEDSFPVSVKAWRTGGSKMFVKVNTQVTVADLLNGIIVQSGNDACVVMAEGLAGTEEAFAELMNKRGKEIGLVASNFRNSTGWPEEGHVMTARDIALLSERLIRDFPEYYHYFGGKNFTFNEIRQGNRNPLLYKDLGVDGLKTGHTEEAGYGLAASAERSGRRLVMVITGTTSMNARSQEAERLLEWGYREFGNYALFAAGAAVDKAEVWLGREDTVPLVVDRPLVVTLPKRSRPKLDVRLVYDGPIAAPIAKGQKIGEIVVSAPDWPGVTVPVTAGASVEQLGLFGRLSAAIRHVLWGASG
jgi:D-alanyl-D-alanine carboxypeptidase (penicillin-binding protein 5/6)